MVVLAGMDWVRILNFADFEKTMIEFKVQGFAELEKQMRDLPAKIEKRILARSVYAGAVIVRTEARSEIAKRTGATSKMVRIFRARSGVKPGTVIYRVGLKENKYVAGLRGHIGRFLEFGTGPHIIRPKKAKALGKDGHLGALVHHPGTRPKPWLLPSFQATTDQVIEAMRMKLSIGVNTEIANQ